MQKCVNVELETKTSNDELERIWEELLWLIDATTRVLGKDIENAE